MNEWCVDAILKCILYIPKYGIYYLSLTLLKIVWLKCPVRDDDL